MFKVFKIVQVASKLFENVSWYNKMGFVAIPLISTMLSAYLNDMVLNVNDYGIFNVLIFKMFNDVMGQIVLMFLLYGFTDNHYNAIKMDFELSALKCGANLHGDNVEMIGIIKKDIYKLREFIRIITMSCSTISSFYIIFYKIGVANEENFYTLILLIVLCFITMFLIYLNTDSKLYENNEQSFKYIYDINDTFKTKKLISMGLKIDLDYEKKKRNNVWLQDKVHKIILMGLDILIAYILLSNNRVSDYRTLTGITWLLGYLTSSSKSLFYYDFVSDLLNTIDMLKRFEYKHDDIIVPLNDFQSVHFLNASYGYYSNNMLINDNHFLVIRNLTYSFKKGMLYYVESENKSGKTSLLRMFTMNLMAGEIAFDTLNRKNVSFENLRENIFHIVQSSEDNDKFTRKELEYLIGKDLWLEKHLKLENILHKGTEELNGGSKKRLYLYMALVSKCQILLLDEVLAELDVNEDETEGALIDTLNALTEWPGRKEKVILLIGHGLKKCIKNSISVQKLGVVQHEDETKLIEF